MAEPIGIGSEIGGYRLMRALGEGGMGVVFEAARRGSRERVALKTVRVPEEAVLSSIRREILALARLRHPGIVRIVSEGVHQGLPWYAMDLVAGTSLRDEGVAPTPVASAEPTVDLSARGASDPAVPPDGDRGTRPIPPRHLRRCLTVVRRLCDALGYLHGEGIVHRDLKPANVMVRRGGWPVIVDFGLAALLPRDVSRESFEIEGATVGTCAYVAPEQARGELVDARADVYALGCMLYELLTGRTPFSGGSPYQELERRFRMDPVPPSRRVPGIPPALDALVLRMLAREPSARIGHVDVVASELVLAGADAAAPEPRVRRSYLYRPGLAGRSALMKRLGDILGDVLDRRGSLVLLGGESGAGKTRVAMALTGEATRMGVAVLVGECEPGPGGRHAAGAPLHPLRAPLRTIAEHCREQGPADVDRVLGPRIAVLAEAFPELAQPPHAAAPSLPPGDARLRLFVHLADTLAAAAGDRPHLLVLDDLHWADELTLAFLDHLAETGCLAGLPLAIVGTYRTEETGETLAALAGKSVRVAVPPLGAEDVGSIVADMLAASPPPEALVASVARRSEGNPFFVAEYLRAAVDEGLLLRDGEGRWILATPGLGIDDRALPGSIEDLVSRRLDGLDDDARRVLQVSAVLGRELSSEWIAPVAGMSEESCLTALGRLVARQILEETVPGRLRFLHDQIREVAYGAIADGPVLHEAAARVLAALPDADEHAADLGFHWEMARNAAEAGRWYAAAARAAGRAFSFDEAARHYRSSLRLAAEPSPAAVELRMELAGTLKSLGRIPDAVAEDRRAVAEATAVGTEAQGVNARNGLGASLMLAGETVEALRVIEAALERARALGDGRLEAMAEHRLASLMYLRGEPGDAEAHFGRALRIAAERHDESLESDVLGNYALLLQSQGRLDESLAVIDRALQLDRRRGARPGEVTLLGSRANALYHLGRLAEARTTFERVVGLAREIGLFRAEATAVTNLASIRAQQGETEAAGPLLEQALRLHRASGERRLEGLVLGNLATLEYLRGDLPRAEARYDEAIAFNRRLGNRWDEGLLLANLGELHALKGDRARAAALLRDAHAILESMGNRREVARLLGARAALEAADGDVARARHSGEEALALAEAVGDAALAGTLLVIRARIERRAGNLASARRLLADGGSRIHASGDRLERCKAICEAGHQRLAGGASAADELEAAARLAESYGLAPASEVGTQAARLRRAQEAFLAGKPLVHCDAPEDAAAGAVRPGPETRPRRRRRRG